MLFKELLDSETRKTSVLQAVDILRKNGVLGAFWDLMRIRNESKPSASPTEHAALRAAWADGYSEALMDLFDFQERWFTQSRAQPKGAPDFGAIKRLLANKEITQKEYDELIGVSK